MADDYSAPVLHQPDDGVASEEVAAARSDVDGLRAGYRPDDELVQRRVRVEVLGVKDVRPHAVGLARGRTPMDSVELGDRDPM